jgi:hypothetical protein
MVEWKIPLNSGIAHDVVLKMGTIVGLGIRYGLNSSVAYPDSYDYQDPF